MGRYTSDTGGGQPRKKTIKLFASDPAVPVPAWAGVVYVTGCGGGGGGGNQSATAGARGGGGGAGGYCVRLPVALAGEELASIIIGDASAGALGGSTASAPDAGNTVVMIGARVITLFGGRGGLASAMLVAIGGYAVIGSAVGLSSGQPTQGPFGSDLVSQGLNGPSSPLSSGAGGAIGNNAASGYGAGGLSIFGAGGDGLASVPGANASGGDASGFGSGGAGSHGTGKAGDGSPGFVMLEFEETA